MKTLPVIAVLCLTSSFALADGCPNLAGKYINMQENADITIAQGEDAGVPYLSFITLNASGGEDVTKLIADGKEHETVTDGAKDSYSVTCADGKLSLHQWGTEVNDFHNGDGDDSQVPAVDPHMPANWQEMLRMTHEAVKNKQSLEMSYDTTMELLPVDRDIQVKLNNKTGIKNLDTKEAKEFSDQGSGVMKRDED